MKALSLSFFLLPFFLIFSRFLADFYISSLGLLCIFFIFKKYMKIPKNIFIYFLFIFYFYLLFSSLFSFDIQVSFFKSLPYFRLIFFSIFLSFIIHKDKKIIHIIILSFLYSHTALFFDSLFQLTFSYNIFGNEIINSRISSFFSDELILGAYISKSFPILLSLIYLNKKNYSDNLVYYFIAISAVMIFLSAERLATITYLVFLVLFFFIHLPLKKFLLSFSIIVVTLSIFAFNGKNNPKVNRLVFHTIDQLKSSSSYIYPSHRHELHSGTAIKMFYDRKYLGQGLNSFRYLCGISKFIPESKINQMGNVKLKKFAPADGILIKKENKIFIMSLFFGPTKTWKNPISVGHEIKEINLENPSLIIFSPFNKFVEKGSLIAGYRVYKNGCNTHPHNLHLQFLAEIGSIGYAFLFVFFIYIFFLILKLLFQHCYYKKNINQSLLFSAFGLFIFLFPLLPSGSFFNNWMSIIFYFNFSIFLHSKLYRKI